MPESGLSGSCGAILEGLNRSRAPSSMDRASGFGPDGWGFESLGACFDCGLGIGDWRFRIADFGLRIADWVLRPCSLRLSSVQAAQGLGVSVYGFSMRARRSPLIKLQRHAGRQVMPFVSICDIAGSDRAESRLNLDFQSPSPARERSDQSAIANLRLRF